MLGDFINFESFLNPDKKNWDFDPESIFYNGSEPTVTVSPKAVAFDIETTFDKSLTPTVTLSSKAPLTAPCDICTYGQQFTLVLDKVRKTNRKNKKV